MTGAAVSAEPVLEPIQGAAGPVYAFDVVEDAKRFVFDETPLDPQGLPGYGNEFVSEGYIYPAGTVVCDDEGCNGILPDGQPEFPELVIGRWTCWGTHVGQGATTPTGAWVATTQIYDFGPELGDNTMISNGYELVDLNKTIKRPLAGGTGQFAAANGTANQTMVGFNASGGVVLRYEIEPARPRVNVIERREAVQPW
ncbi:hypothetical protein ABI59_23615 [Acidobacteria bacterium Mor1]|nr:hypothetical protein ABI59_23615 [Acidobacteria bacterium Mor1]